MYGVTWGVPTGWIQSGPSRLYDSGTLYYQAYRGGEYVASVSMLVTPSGRRTADALVQDERDKEAARLTNNTKELVVEPALAQPNILGLRRRTLFTFSDGSFALQETLFFAYNGFAYEFRSEALIGKTREFDGLMAKSLASATLASPLSPMQIQVDLTVRGQTPRWGVFSNLYVLIRGLPVASYEFAYDSTTSSVTLVLPGYATSVGDEIVFQVWAQNCLPCESTKANWRPGEKVQLALNFN